VIISKICKLATITQNISKNIPQDGKQVTDARLNRCMMNQNTILLYAQE